MGGRGASSGKKGSPKSKGLLSREIIATLDDKQKKIYDVLADRNTGTRFIALKSYTRHSYLVGENTTTKELMIFDVTQRRSRFSKPYLDFNVTQHTSEELADFLKSLTIERVIPPQKKT